MTGMGARQSTRQMANLPSHARRTTRGGRLL
jgi:hypothetical protein